MMESLYFLVPFALIFIVIAIKILSWAIHNGQYDNLDTEAHRILFDADPASDKFESGPHAGKKDTSVIHTDTASTQNIAKEDNHD